MDKRRKMSVHGEGYEIELWSADGTTWQARGDFRLGLDQVQVKLLGFEAASPSIAIVRCCSTMMNLGGNMVRGAAELGTHVAPP